MSTPRTSARGDTSRGQGRGLAHGQMRQRITDIFVVNATYSVEEEGVVEVEALPAHPDGALEAMRRPSHPEFDGDNHTVEEISVAIDNMLGTKTTPVNGTMIPRTDVAAMRPRGFQKLGSKMPFSIAKSKDDITPEWCTQVFRHRGYLTASERITSLECKPIGAGEGEFSDLALLTITQVDGGDAPALPRSMIAKFSPPNVKGLELKIVFGTEAHMYNDVSCEGMQLVRPEAVYIGAELPRFSKARYCFLIANANPPLQPALMFKRQAGCDSVPHLMIAMRGLARFHARWWGAPQKAPLDFAFDPSTGGGPLPRLPRCLGHTISVMIIKAGLKALPHCFLDLPHMQGAPKFGAEYRELIFGVGGSPSAIERAGMLPVMRRRRHAVARELVKPPLTLCHGDAHLENIFFAEHFEGGCMFIDFGLTGFGQALADVAMVVGAGMKPEVRRAHERDLVSYYHSCLEEYGVKNYSHEQCWQDFQFQLFRPFFSLLTIAPSFARQRKKREGMFSPNPSEGDQKLYAMYKEINTRLASALMDHKFNETIADFPITAPYCCRPCC